MYVYCSQTTGWINMPFGIKIDFGPDRIVLDGHPAPLLQRGLPFPIFALCLLWGKRSLISATAEHWYIQPTQIGYACCKQ